MGANIGGYFATLALKSDQASFDKSKKDLKSIQDQTRQNRDEFLDFTAKAIAGLGAMGAAAISAAYEVAKIQGKTQLNAASSGMKFSEMQSWANMLQLLTLNADSLTSGFENVNSAVNDFKGSFKTESWNSLAKNLALLNISPKDFLGLTPEQRVLTVAKAAEGAPEKLKKSWLDIANEIYPGLANVIIQTQRTGTKYPSVQKAYEAGAEMAPYVEEEDVTKANEAMSAFTTAARNLGQATVNMAGKAVNINDKLQTAADNFSATAQVLARPYENEAVAKAKTSSEGMKQLTQKADAFEKAMLDAWEKRKDQMKKEGKSDKEIQAEREKLGIHKGLLWGKDYLDLPRTNLPAAIKYFIEGEDVAKKLVKPSDISAIEQQYPAGSTINISGVTYTIDKSIIEDAATMRRFSDASLSPESSKQFVELMLLLRDLEQ